jgi:hypothetical protein
MLAKVAKGEKGGEQNTNGKGKGNYTRCPVEHKFKDGIPFYPFAGKIVDVLPDHLHQKEKNHDSYSRNQWFYKAS